TFYVKLTGNAEWVLGSDGVLGIVIGSLDGAYLALLAIHQQFGNWGVEIEDSGGSDTTQLTVVGNDSPALLIFKVEATQVTASINGVAQAPVPLSIDLATLTPDVMMYCQQVHDDPLCPT